MSDLDYLDYLREQEEYNPFLQEELPRQVRDAYSESQDWEAAA